MESAHMRLFTGLDLPAEVVHNLELLLERLRPTARIHWTVPANLHITTKFIGEWPEERLGELKAALAALEPQPPIAVDIRKVGVFPKPFRSGSPYHHEIHRRVARRAAGRAESRAGGAGTAAAHRGRHPQGRVFPQPAQSRRSAVRA